MALAAVLLVTAAGFAVLNGMNNGSALVAIATTSTSLLPITAIALLASGVVLGPLCFGTRVATTVSRDLVEGSGPLAARVFLVGILAAMAVIGILAWLGLPSSLTVATVGGLAGSGLAAGLHVGEAVVLLVVVLAIAAPLGAGLLTFVSTKIVLALLPLARRQRDPRKRLRWLRHASFAVQSLAYGTNDGQRMLAVLIVALRAGWPTYKLNVLVDAALAGTFGLGALLGTARMARGSPGQITPADTLERSLSSVTASLAAFSSAAIGIPLSMSQTTSAALVGAHATVGRKRVRWESTTKLLGAWAITLPASAALAAAATSTVNWVR